MQQYRDLCHRVLSTGRRASNRTSQDTFMVWGDSMHHELREGFPLLTTKKMATTSRSGRELPVAFIEMLGFCRGETDVRWYQTNGCRVWDADHARWHGEDLERDRESLKVPLGITGIDLPPTYSRTLESVEGRDANPHSLGRIYGAQWRDFGGVDQLANICEALREGSTSRQLVMSAWNPAQLHLMALPPCPVLYHFQKDGNYLNIGCFQRSADPPLGVPFNWAGQALLGHLVAHYAGLKPGTMFWTGTNIHVYENQRAALTEQMEREPRPLPQLEIKARPGTPPWEIEPEDLQIFGYDPHPAIKIPLTVS